MKSLTKLTLFLFSLTHLVASGIEVGELIWTYSAADTIYTTPSIGPDGTIYFGAEDNQFYAITPEGELRWKFSGSTDWIDSSPLITKDGLVVFGSWDGKIYALDKDVGSLVWSYDTESFITGSPVADDLGNIYIGSFGSAFFSLSTNGELRWKTNLYSPIDSSPAIGPNGRVYIGDTGGFLYAIQPEDGSVLWFFSVSDVDIISTEIGFLSSPAINADGILYIGNQNTYLYAIDTELPSGTTSQDRIYWSIYAEEAIDSSPVITESGDITFAARDGYLYQIDSGGFQLWERLIGDVFYSSPAIDSQGNVFIVSYTGSTGVVQSSINSINSKGEEIWTYSISNYNDSSINIAPDGSIYVGAHDGKIYKLKGNNRLAIEGWPKFLGNRSNSAVFDSAEQIDSLDFFPKLSPIDGVWAANGTYDLINIQSFPSVYSNKIGWIDCTSILTPQTLNFHHHAFGWLFPAPNATDLYFQFSSQSWLEFKASSSPLNLNFSILSTGQ